MKIKSRPAVVIDLSLDEEEVDHLLGALKGFCSKIHPKEELQHWDFASILEISLEKVSKQAKKKRYSVEEVSESE